MGAIQGKYPEFVMKGMNDYTMAKAKELLTKWTLTDSILVVRMILVAAIVVQVILQSQGGGVKVGAMLVHTGSQSGEGWIDLAE